MRMEFYKLRGIVLGVFLTFSLGFSYYEDHLEDSDGVHLVDYFVVEDDEGFLSLSEAFGVVDDLSGADFLRDTTPYVPQPWPCDMKAGDCAKLGDTAPYMPQPWPCDVTSGDCARLGDDGPILGVPPRMQFQIIR